MATLNLTKNVKTLSRLFAADNLTQKAYLNAFAATLDYGARLVAGLIFTPFLVAGLGDTFYGVWRTLGNLTGYISAASGRPSQALKSTIANQQSSQDYDEKRRNVTSAIIVWLLFCPLLAVLGGVVVWFAPLWIKDLPANLYGIVRIAALLLVMDMILTALTVLPQSVLEGENLGYKRMGISACLTFVGSGLAILALYLNTGLVGVAVAEVTTTIITGLFFLSVVRNNVPWWGFAKPPRATLVRFFGLSWWFLLWRLVTQLMTASDLIILGVFASAQLVTTYSLTKYASETLINFVAIVVFGITPGLGGIIGSGDFEKAARVRNEIVLLSWLVTTIIGSVVLLCNQTFVTLWVGPQHFAGSQDNLLILILTIQFILIRNDSNIIDLTLKLSQKVILGLVSAAISVLTATVLVGVFKTGIIGLVLGLMAGRAILSLMYPKMIGRLLGVSLVSQLRSAVRPMLITAFLFGLIFILSSRLNTIPYFEPTWITLFGLAIITGATASLLTIFVGLTGNQRESIWQRLRLVATRISA